MKRFKRRISEVAKGMFHGGSEGPIIPNLGVNSKKPAPTNAKGGSTGTAEVKAAGEEEVSPAKSTKKHSPLGEAKLKKKRQADKRAEFAKWKGGSKGESDA